MSVPHDRAVILSTGDELMTGQLQDSNARWLSEQLVSMGVLVVGHIAVGDDLSDLATAIQSAAARVPLVIMSGGLGPTDGDLTREAICRITADELVLDEQSRSDLNEKLSKRGRQMTARQERQAFRPSRATPLANAFGTAPGLHVRIGPADAGADLFCLPGPPGELRPMFEASIQPRLRPPQNRVVLTRLLHVVGLPEADAAQRLSELTRRDRSPLVGMTASGGILTIRIRHEADRPANTEGREQAAAEVNAVESRVRQILGKNVLPLSSTPVHAGVEHLAAVCIDALRSGVIPGRTLAVVESCTGGMLGETLTGISGSSAAFVGGFITYANELKEKLGVRPATLAEFGAVSPQTAIELARCGLKQSGADVCLAITGIAGPEGGTPGKPVGTVHIGLAAGMVTAGGAVHSRHFLFTGDREDIRRRACTTALTMLYFHLTSPDAETRRLLWELPSSAPARFKP